MMEPVPAKPSPEEGLLAQGSPPPGEKAALTITIQSWATLVVGALMLGIGLLAGYFGHPILNPLPPTATAIPTSPNPQPTLDPANSASGDQAARQQALMDTLIAQTRHFKGDPDAPVTLIEFSDFQ